MKKVCLFLFAICMVKLSIAQGGLLDKAKNKAGGLIKSGDKKEEVKTTTPGSGESKTQSEDTGANSKYFVADMGITSPTHQKNLDKIVFSKELIERGKEDESKLITEYTLGEDLYFRFYYPRSLYNMLIEKSKKVATNNHSGECRTAWEFYLDGQLYLRVDEGQDIKDEDEIRETWTTICNGLYYADGKSTNAAHRMFKNFLYDAREKMTPGMHEVEIKLFPFMSAYNEPVVEFTEPAASGKFKMKVKEIDPSDPKVCYPKAEMQDKEVEAALVAAYNKAYPGGADVFAIVTSEEWFLLRNEISGIITGRAIDGAMVYRKEGKCYYEVVGFEQDHDGTTFSKKARVANLGGLYDIPCACLDKK